MRINKKGQMIVLDVLFAIVLIMLAFFLILKISEIEIYSSSSQRKVNELNRIGNLSYSLLLNGETKCFVSNNNQKFYIPGTFKTGSVVTKRQLGIPSNYNCNLTIEGVSISSNECTTSTPPSKDIYEISFKIGSCSEISASNYFNCMKESCSGVTERNANLKIWKAD